MIGDKEILKLAFEVHTAGMLEVIETGKMPNVKNTLGKLDREALSIH